MIVPVHDEEVLVIVLQDGITILWVTEVLLSEGITYPWHEDIVKVQKVKTMLELPVLASPSVTQDTSKQ